MIGVVVIGVTAAILALAVWLRLLTFQSRKRRQNAMQIQTTGDTPAPSSQDDGVARPLRILLVDDIEMNRHLARILLARLGHAFDEAADGQQALDALAREHYDLVLMDCIMPGMDGYEATRQLRRREADAGKPVNRRTVVIALTAGATDDQPQRCLDAGMDDYLPKPLTSERFAAILTRWRSQAR